MGSPGKKQFPLRLDPALWEEIERLAAIELRSSNAQIELLLREALKRRGIKPSLSPSARRGRPPTADADAPVAGDQDHDPRGGPHGDPHSGGTGGTDGNDLGK